MNRAIKIALGGVGVLAAAGAGAVLWLRKGLDTAGLEEGLIASVAAIEAAKCTRPSHVDPILPGTFGDALVPHLEGLQRAREAVDQLAAGEKHTFDAIVKGQIDLEATPAIQTVLESSREAVRGALAASHAADACPPPGLRTIADPADPLNKRGLLPLLTAAKLAAADIRRLNAENKPNEGLALCVDGMGYARDLSWGPTMLAAMVSGAAVGALRPACGEAIDHASPDARAAAAVPLALVREGFRPFPVSMREEYVSMELIAFGGLMKKERGARLSPTARAMITANSPLSTGFAGGMFPSPAEMFEARVMRFAWREAVPMRDSILEALARPREERDRKLEEIAHRAEASPNPITRIAFADPRRFAEKWEHALEDLDRLIQDAGRE